MSRAPAQLRDGGFCRAEALWESLQARHPYPLTVIVGLTDRCNLRCGHCLVPRPDGERTLDGDELGSLLDELAGLGVLRLVLTGGEPSLRDDLEALVAAAVARRFVVQLKSNGTLLDATRVRGLLGAGLSKLDVSLYHPDAAAHDEFVGAPGAWDQTARAAESFAAGGGQVQVSLNAMAWNWERLPALAAWAEAQGYGWMCNSLIVCGNDGDADPLRYRLGEAELAELMRRLPLLDHEALGQAAPKAADAALCGAGKTAPFIQPNGDVTLCQRLPQVLGNVRSASFAAIWESSEARQAFLASRWGDLAECLGCEHSKVCARCPASALLEDGDVTGISSGDCAQARAKARVLAEGDPHAGTGRLG